jgi:hypothetical protein
VVIKPHHLPLPGTDTVRQAQGKTLGKTLNNELTYLAAACSAHLVAALPLALLPQPAHHPLGRMPHYALQLQRLHTKETSIQQTPSETK